MKLLKLLLKEAPSMNSIDQARAEIESGPDRDERQDRARQSNAQLVRDRAKEIEDETESLKNSKDPIDKKLYMKKRQLARLQDEIDKLTQQKQQAASREA